MNLVRTVVVTLSHLQEQFVFDIVIIVSPQSSIQHLMNLGSQRLRTVTFNFMENPQTVTVLKILMASEVNAKNVRFSPSTTVWTLGSISAQSVLESMYDLRMINDAMSQKLY